MRILSIDAFVYTPTKHSEPPLESFEVLHQCKMQGESEFRHPHA